MRYTEEDAAAMQERVARNRQRNAAQTAQTHSKRPQTPKQAASSRVSEKSVMLTVKTALCALGWRVLRVPPSIYGSAGWCDLIALKGGRVIFIECKRPGGPGQAPGKLSTDQEVFRQMIIDAGGVYVLARSWADVEAAI